MMPNRIWNFTAAIAGCVTLIYLGALGAGLYVGRLEVADFAQYALPVVTPWTVLVGIIVRGD